MILGLDVSTSITGLAIVNDSGKLILSDYVDTRNKNKYKDLFEVSLCIRTKLEEIKKAYEIKKVCVEQAAQLFRMGSSSAKTISTLLKVNGIVSYLCYEVFGIKPDFINVSSARKICSIKIRRGSNSKEVVLKHILDTEEDFVIEYTRTGKPKPYCYDMADAIVIAKSAWIQCRPN